jgi:adenylate kinase family enzyme
MTQAYLVCGSPAAGKTTYGKKLAEKKQAVFLDIDVSTERLVRLALDLSGQDPEDRDSPYFKKHFRDPIYEQLFDSARDNLPLRSVVIAGPFTQEIKDPDWPKKLTAHLGAPVKVHYVFCPSHIRKERMTKRAHSRDEGKLRDRKNHLHYYEDEPAPACEHFPVDNSADFEV